MDNFIEMIDKCVDEIDMYHFKYLNLAIKKIGMTSHFDICRDLLHIFPYLLPTRDLCINGDIIKNEFKISEIMEERKLDMLFFDTVIFNYENGVITMECPGISSIRIQLSIISHRYSYLPCVFYLKSQGHMGSIIIDKLKKNIYLFDSNGYACFYDVLLDEDVIHIIDGIMDLFSKEVLSDFEYIPCREWSSNDTAIHYLIDDTHKACVVATYLFLHSLTYTQMDVEDAIKYLSSLESEAIQELLRKYHIVLRKYMVENQVINHCNLVGFVNKYGVMKN